MSDDVLVVGSGPNGLAAAITLAQRGRRVVVREANATIGGSARSLPLTLDGFVHDVCSAIHPLAVASPFFRSLDLERHGLAWVHPEAPLAHPLDDSPAVLLERSVEATLAHLDPVDRRAWSWLFGPLSRRFDDLVPELLGPIVHAPSVRGALPLLGFGPLALLPATWLAKGAFRGERARALFGGSAAHALTPLEWPTTGAFGMLLSLAGHAVGWPFPRGGAQSLIDALVVELRALGGEVVASAPVTDARELVGRTVMFDIGPRQLVGLVGDELPSRYRDALSRFRYGPGTFKLDWALSEPVPWRDPAVARAACVHLGGTLDELARSERAPWQGTIDPAPYVLFAQHSLFDDARAPAGKHTAWAYCHVPNGSTVDMTDAIEAQVERFAPGFRDTILARHVTCPGRMSEKNANLIGGDLSGGANTPWQLLARPRLVDPYRVPGGQDWWLCSASTPPGGGVHGMCGWQAAVRAAR